MKPFSLNPPTAWAPGRSPSVPPAARAADLALAARVPLRRQDEVVLAQPADRVGPEREPHLAPGEEDVGMVAFRFGHLSHPVDEFQGLPEVLETVLLLQVVLVDHRPATVDSSEEPAR